VQKWLGHHSPGFTLDRYVHLMDDGVGDAEFTDDAVRVLPSELPSAPFGADHGRAVEPETRMAAGFS
jgi:hypothetical protein